MMGMFDNIYVKASKINLPMPKNGYYQTKDLDCNLCKIQMDEDGLMTCPKFYGGEWYPVDRVKDLHLGYYNSGEFNFYGDDVHGKWHEFRAEVKYSRIVKLWSYNDLLYDASNIE